VNEGKYKKREAVLSEGHSRKGKAEENVGGFEVVVDDGLVLGV
jgi:hypothetical protein